MVLVGLSAKCYPGIPLPGSETLVCGLAATYNLAQSVIDEKIHHCFFQNT